MNFNAIKNVSLSFVLQVLSPASSIDYGGFIAADGGHVAVSNMGCISFGGVILDL